MPRETTASNLGPFPQWDLSVFYTNADDPQIDKDKQALAHDAKRFRKAFENKVADLDGEAFGKAIERYEQLQDRQGRLSSFAYLYRALDVESADRGRFLQNCIVLNGSIYRLFSNKIAKQFKLKNTF